MRLPIVFGKRDQDKYKKVINWLSTIEDGWRNQAVKDALLSYIENQEINTTFSIEKPRNTQAYNSKPLAEKITQENGTQNETIDTSNIDDFLGDF